MDTGSAAWVHLLNEKGMSACLSFRSPKGRHHLQDTISISATANHQKPLDHDHDEAAFFHRKDARS
jgi:hypothetical protein